MTKPIVKQTLETLREDINALAFSIENAKTSHVHSQSQPSVEWNIEHGLNKYPSVAIVDSTENLVIGNVEYIDENNLKVSFTGAFSGKAYIN